MSSIRGFPPWLASKPLLFFFFVSRHRPPTPEKKTRLCGKLHKGEREARKKKKKPEEYSDKHVTRITSPSSPEPTSRLHKQSGQL
ncbi:hypothetical protein V5799_006596 [Amblyomma americanum]|uniref:Uncharacterized protein n=1 Tax=Amblyomma americanum TaxID=6943 RepID=A0AAQ4DVY6_AMBAM